MDTRACRRLGSITAYPRRSKIFSRLSIHDHGGGEDLPDLEDGEVDIAPLSRTNSVHVEVTSLHAKLDGDGVLLRMLDEY